MAQFTSQKISNELFNEVKPKKVKLQAWRCSSVDSVCLAHTKAWRWSLVDSVCLAHMKAWVWSIEPPKTREVETGGPKVQGQLEQHKAYLKKKKTSISGMYKKNDYRKTCPQFLLKFITFIQHNYFSSGTLRE